LKRKELVNRRTVIAVGVTRIMANVSTPGFQKFLSSQIEYLRLEYRDIVQDHEADAVIERVRGVLIAIARLAGCTPASVGESPKWTLIVQNMAETKRNLQQYLK
jgi:hypothetical protein